MGYLKRLWLVLAFVLLECNSIHSQGKEACDLKDAGCVTKSFQNIYKSKDFQELISTLYDDNTTTGQMEDLLSYELTDMTMYGMENCEVISLQLYGENDLRYQYDVFCPQLDISYNYKIRGKSFIPNFYAEGLGSGVMDNCFIYMNGNNDVYTSERDQKPRLRFNDVNFDMDLQGRYVISNEEVTQGNPFTVRLAETAINNLGQRILQKYARDPVLTTFTVVFMEKFNEYLAAFPIEDFFVK